MPFMRATIVRALMNWSNEMVLSSALVFAFLNTRSAAQSDVREAAQKVHSEAGLDGCTRWSGTERNRTRRSVGQCGTGPTAHSTDAWAVKKAY
eukprot:365151-Chlamydomonas_euryale.AAC.20